ASFSSKWTIGSSPDAPLRGSATAGGAPAHAPAEARERDIRIVGTSFGWARLAMKASFISPPWAEGWHTRDTEITLGAPTIATISSGTNLATAGASCSLVRSLASLDS